MGLAARFARDINNAVSGRLARRALGQRITFGTQALGGHAVVHGAVTERNAVSGEASELPRGVRTDIDRR